MTGRETTGLSWQRDEITQVCFRLLWWRPEEGGACRGRYEPAAADIVSFVRTERLLSAKVQQITGITQADVRDAPTFDEVYARLRGAVDAAFESGPAGARDVIFVAHNAFKFDCPFLYRAVARLSLIHI